MITKRAYLFFIFLLYCVVQGSAKEQRTKVCLPADARPELYLPNLTGKKVAIVMNVASVSNDTLVLERLLQAGITVTKIFVPEHGFRGSHDAGEHINNMVDSATGIPVISLYGSHKMPNDSDMMGIDILVYDLQDVGVRFYTYISTLEYCMKACIRSKTPLMVLDRPNPNGFYVDGPVLDTQYRSFVGMQQVPVVYGMTVGEYAKMIVGEKWIDSSEELKMTVMPCIGYHHALKYKLPVPPSPNLRDMAAVYAYPSLCLFEGTVVSVGRGTDKPFRQYGNPDFKGVFSYSFMPLPAIGAKHPLYEQTPCFGVCVGESEQQVLDTIQNKLHISWIINAYQKYPFKNRFFNSFFEKLSGTSRLRKAIENGLTETEIRAEWEMGIRVFKKIRKHYLLYPDFY